MIFSKKTGVRVVACAHVGTRHDPQPGFAKPIILILLMLKPSILLPAGRDVCPPHGPGATARQFG